MNDVNKYAYFPFLNKASKYVGELGIPISELFSEKAYEQIRLRGKERILEAINGELLTPDIKDKIGAEKELLSYPISRIMVSCINDSYLIRRYSLIEAESTHKRLKELDVSFLIEVAYELEIEAIQHENNFKLHFTDYIKYANSIHEHRWKLINRKMEKGWVYLTKEELLRLIQEAVKKKIESGLPLKVLPKMCEHFESYFGEIRETLGKLKSKFNIEEFKEIMFDGFPPCVNHALSQTQSGMNLSHSMRFALTSFLLNIGMSIDGIIELFKVSPDFDEEHTRYQVMHIKGASGTKYISPSCSTMITYGNCYGKEPLCEKISHPLSYYRKKTRILKKNSSTEKHIP